MRIPDYLAGCSTSGFLERVSFSRQTKDDEETELGLFDVTFDVVLTLQDRLVDEAPPYLRHAVDALRTAKDGKGTTVVRYEPLSSERNVRVSVVRGQWVAFEDAGAEVRVLEVVATKDSPRFHAKIKVEGISSGECGALLECVKRPIEVGVEPIQASLPLAS